MAHIDVKGIVFVPLSPFVRNPSTPFGSDRNLVLVDLDQFANAVHRANRLDGADASRGRRVRRRRLSNNFGWRRRLWWYLRWRCWRRHE